MSKEENLSTDKKDIRLKITNHMRSFYGLDDDQIEKLLLTAKKTLADNFSAAESALKGNDYKNLGFFAHAIKGSLLNLGLNDSSDKAKKIEVSVRENLEIDFEGLLSQLSNDIADLLAI